MNKKTKKYNCKALSAKRFCFHKHKKVVLKCKFTFKHSKGTVCKRKMCCGKKGCHYTKDKETCEKVATNFCHWSFTRRGACRKLYCCTKNDKGKMKCTHKGKTICRRVVKKVVSLKEKLEKKIFCIKAQIFWNKKINNTIQYKILEFKKEMSKKDIKIKSYLS